MIRKILLCLAFVLAVHAFAPAKAAAQSCGGAGDVPCYVWSWCAYTTPSVFGPVCWGGLVYATPWNGCGSDRLNNWGLVCVACGAAGQPTCDFGTTCDTDQRYTPFGLCYPCGRGGQPACTSGASCDEGFRSIFGFCSYSGFSTEPTTNVVTMPTLTQAATGPVRGIADLHTHQFSNLGFGGVVFWGAPYDAGGINSALPWCDYTWKFSTQWSSTGLEGPIAPTLGYEIHGPKALQALTHPLSQALPEGQHDVSGTGPFDGWPTYNTFTHQMMYYKWLERAYLGGIRLIVVHMVSNEALCKAGKRRSDFTCNDMDAVDKQIQAAKDLEHAIDLMDDGKANNSGWYRIAYSPSQARDIIRAGKLAVVLGIEVDSLFNCKPGSTNCTQDFLHTQLQSYFSKGIRHVFPIHQYDNAFGGAALFKNELNAGNIVVTGNHFKVYDCSSQGYTYNVEPTVTDVLNWLVNGNPLPDQSYYDSFAADCNERGLTDTGRTLIQEMMNLKFIIDTDHMGRRMVDDVMAIAQTTTTDRPNMYPLVSSHSNFQSKEATKDEFSVTDAQLDIFKKIGGMVTAPNPKGECDTSATYKDIYQFAVGKMQQDASDKFAGVGFSTDVNGFAGNTGPRFGDSKCPGTAGTQLQYPFTGIMGGTFDKQTTGSRTFDFNTSGEAHYGLLADFFADLKQTGMTDSDLDPLLNSAETYIRLWERVNSSNQLPPPTITPQVNGTQGANGWFTSDVTVTWDVQSDPRAGTPTTVGCGPTTITTDTFGTPVICTATNPTGESSTSSIFIRRDATPPTFTATRLTPAPASGWTNQDVIVHFQATDSLSGIGGNATADVRLTREGANQTAMYWFYDRAGNVVQATLGGINIDKTPPHIGFRFANLPPTATAADNEAEKAKWHNKPVTLIVDAQDSLSGVDSVNRAQFTFTAEGISLGATATAVDKAGNSTTVTSDPIKIDLTPPTISFVSRFPVANVNGWNNSDITATWNCTDALSGVVSAQVSQTLSKEGANQSLTGACVDLAGNTTTDTRGGLNLDKTPPVVRCAADPAVLWPPDSRMLPVNVALTFTDALSGTWSYALTQASSNELGGADDITGFAIGSTSLSGSLRAQRDGFGTGRFYTLGYQGRDRAGNTAACSTTVTVPHDPEQD